MFPVSNHLHAPPSPSTSWQALLWGASAFFGLDEAWENLPPLPDIVEKLGEWGIMDESLTEEGLKERYVRFEGVTFGVAPESTWPQLRRDLLEFEEYLACRQHDIGVVPEFPFSMTLAPGASVQ